MIERCFYCGDALTWEHFQVGLATTFMPGTYAHVDCINSHRKGNTMDERTARILASAEGVHTGIDLAIFQLQSALGDVGKILTLGCDCLGIASLGSSMRLGQCIKETYFQLEALGTDAVGLAVLLGKDLGVPGAEGKGVSPGPPRPSAAPGYRERMFGGNLNDGSQEAERNMEFFDRASTLGFSEIPPGEDEFDDDDIPF